MDEPRIHYSKLKKPDTKGHIVYDFIYMKCPEQANSYRQKVDLCFLGTVSNGEESGC